MIGSRVEVRGPDATDPWNEAIVEEKKVDGGVCKVRVTIHPPKHPLRAVSLGNVLDTTIWNPPKFDSKGDLQNAFAQLWERSHTVTEAEVKKSYQGRCVGYFVSHAWKDDGQRKVAMLREFLCLDYLMGQLIVISIIMTIFLVPLGLAVVSYLPGFPFWGPCLVPTSVLVLVTLWVQGSLCGCVPSRLAPWAFSSSTLWLDKCCVCQKTPETIEQGVKGFKRFLGHCDKLVVFASPTYFTRLW